MKKELIETGEIVNTHGIRGEVKINPWCDAPEFLLEFDTFYIDNMPVLSLIHISTESSVRSRLFSSLKQSSDLRQSSGGFLIMCGILKRLRSASAPSTRPISETRSSTPAQRRFYPACASLRNDAGGRLWHLKDVYKRQAAWCTAVCDPDVFCSSSSASS